MSIPSTPESAQAVLILQKEHIPVTEYSTPQKTPRQSDHCQSLPLITSPLPERYRSVASHCQSVTGGEPADNREQMVLELLERRSS